MMNFLILRRLYLCVLIVSLSSDVLVAQENEADSLPPLNTGFVTFGLGFGATSFIGDVGASQNRNFTNNLRWGPNFSIERRFGKILGIGINGVTGKLSQNERSLTRNLNFESSFFQIGANAQAHFDTRSDIHFAPYLMAGFSYMSFDPFGDLKDENDQPYFYWSNGTIKNVPEFDENGDIIQENQNLNPDDVDIKRDYTYESQLTTTSDPSASTYTRNTYVIPLTLGFKFKVKEFWEVRMFGSYNITFSDYLDNYAAKGNDAFIYGGISVHYTWGEKYIPKHERPYIGKEELFKSMLNDDSDRDRVLDFNDLCSHTPRGVKVNPEDGCPLDADKDGVYDYLDKEPNTAKGAVVNRYGVTMTDEDIEKRREMREGTYAERISKFYASEEDGTISFGGVGRQIDEEVRNRNVNLTSAIPRELRFADFNNDGIVQSDEVTMAIDCFFEGECDVTVSTIMEMIDFFFEQ